MPCRHGGSAGPVVLVSMLSSTAFDQGGLATMGPSLLGHLAVHREPRAVIEPIIDRASSARDMGMRQILW